MAGEDQLSALARWALVDPNSQEDMASLQDAMTFAEGYLLGAGVPVSDSPVREVLLRKLALYYFENRSADSKGVYPEPPPDLNALILQARCSG